MEGLILNPFDTAGYDLITLTKGINIVPNQYGRINEMGLFADDPVTTRMIGVEEEHGVISLLQTQPPGGPATQNKRGTKKMRSFVVPHIPLEDQIYASEYGGQRQFGSATGVETLNRVMLKHITQMRNKHAITLEFQRMGALKGIILDADGSTIYNLYTEFGITAKALTFALATATTNVAGKCREVLRHIEDNLMGEIMTGVHCLCSEQFFDALIGHSEVEKFYLGHAKAVELAGSGEDPRKSFSFGGITFEEYRGRAPQPDGTIRKFITDGDAHFFPVGTMDTFKTHFAPADMWDTLGELGKELYARQVMEKKQRYVELYTESNPLAMCRRPAVLVRGYIN